jgi:tRNA G10  N-methylase Trm11
VLDPCCGAGTILIEASTYGVEALGGDSHLGAVTAARFNAAQAEVTSYIQRWDARSLPLSNGSVDRVISNLPWGRAVTTDVSLQSLYRAIGEEIERILVHDGKVVLLTNSPEAVQFKRLKCDQQMEISLFGQTPTIMIWSNRT